MSDDREIASCKYETNDLLKPSYVVTLQVARIRNNLELSETIAGIDFNSECKTFFRIFKMIFIAFLSLYLT